MYKYRCPKCYKTFRTKTAVDSHMDLHKWFSEKPQPERVSAREAEKVKRTSLGDFGVDVSY